MRNNRKALAKAITWRIVSSVTTFTMAWIWFGDYRMAGGFALAESFVKFTEYYLHELAWQGKMKPNVKRRKQKRLGSRTSKPNRRSRS